MLRFMHVEWTTRLPGPHAGSRLALADPKLVYGGVLHVARESPSAGLIVHAIAVDDGRSLWWDTVEMDRWASHHGAGLVVRDGAVALHANRWWRVEDGTLDELPDFPTGSADDVLFEGNDVIAANVHHGEVFRGNLATGKVRWRRDLKNTRHRVYSIGPVARFEGELLCYGAERLNLLDPETGDLLGHWSVRHADILYPPIRHEGDLVFGYTSGTVGGVLRLDGDSGKVRWRYKMKGGEGVPAGLVRETLVIGDTALWVRGDTQLVGVDVNTGTLRWKRYTSPHRYTDLHVFGSHVAYGTVAQPDTAVVSVIDPRSDDGALVGQFVLRSEWLDLERTERELLLGDLDGVLHVVRVPDCEEVGRVELDGAIVGSPLVVGDSCYVTTHHGDNAPPCLSRVRLS